LARVAVLVAGVAAVVPAAGSFAIVCKTISKVVATILIKSVKFTPCVLAAAEPMAGAVAVVGVVAVVFVKPAVAAVDDVAVTPVNGTPPVVDVVARPVLGVNNEEIADMPVLPVVKDDSELLMEFAVSKSAAEPLINTPLILPDKAGGMTVGPLSIDNGCVISYSSIFFDWETLKRLI
jgi:hypothetical protein